MTVISPDGSRVVYSSGGVVYLAENGINRAISVSHKQSDEGAVRPGSLIGGGRDLDEVYFIALNLTEDSPVDRPSFYRYDIASETLEFQTQVSDDPFAIDFNFLQLSEDGSSAYFSSLAALTPDAQPGGALKTYAWRNGELDLVGNLENDNVVQFWWTSPSGRYFAFVSASNLTGYDGTNPQCFDTRIGEEGICKQVYRYDADAKELLCASCPVDGRTPSASAYMSESFADAGTHSFVRSVDDQGQVFFGSKDQLVAGDVNSSWDVYEFDGEQQRLISTGHGGDALLSGVSADGDDVFFGTTDRLVASDTDNAADLYDARVGGGIASQNQSPADTSCVGAFCGTDDAVAPPSPPAGSEAVKASPKPSARHRRQRCTKATHRRKAGGQHCGKKHKSHKKQANDKHRRQGK
jgi:hypothetical protein